MPYEYRRLTLEERNRIVEERIQRGYPRHAPPHPYRGIGAYLLTAANFEHEHMIHPEGRRTEFEARLLEMVSGIAANVFAWVVLTNHYHVLIHVDSLNKVSAAIKRLHGRTSYEWNLADGMTGKRRVWYRYTDRMIRNDQHFYQTMNYVHMNPVKHGYVNTPYDWPWSSVHNYLETQGREWLCDRWQAFPPGDYGKGWDDEVVAT